ncbi:hypothetical protein AAZX31_03G088100 [Glycine max]
MAHQLHILETSLKLEKQARILGPNASYYLKTEGHFVISIKEWKWVSVFLNTK